MKIIKKALIFKPDGQFEWMNTHAQVPAVLVLDDCYRIYFATRDKNSISNVACIDVDKDNPEKVLKVYDKPVLSTGTLGGFDEDGVVPSCVLRQNNEIWLYYNGWNKKVTTPYHNAIGLAVSNDNGLSFKRMYDGPIIERNILEPYMHVSPSVLKENNGYKMWYVSGTKWITLNNKPEPVYVLRYADSKDGIHWNRTAVSCIEQKDDQEAVATPSVIYDKNKYRMWYCFRGSVDFRDGTGSYRMGYAESDDGIKWQRNDDQLDMYSFPADWDSSMQCYPYIIKTEQGLLMFYSGNGFGKSGIGYALIEE